MNQAKPTGEEELRDKLHVILGHLWSVAVTKANERDEVYFAYKDATIEDKVRLLLIMFAAQQPQPTNPEGTELEDNFGQWLEANGVILEQWEESKGFRAFIDLNKLKAAVFNWHYQQTEQAVLEGRIVVYKKVERNWHRNDFKEFIFDLHDNDEERLKSLKSQQAGKETDTE